MSRPARWEIRETDDGYDITCGNRSKMHGPSRTMCEKWIKKRKKPGDQIWLVELDGYRTKL
jgi:hypothetical protein